MTCAHNLQPYILYVGDNHDCGTEEGQSRVPANRNDWVNTRPSPSSWWLYWACQCRMTVAMPLPESLCPPDVVLSES